MIQNGFFIGLCKTDIVNVDENVHGLPPFKGYFQEFLVGEYPGCPKEWSRDGVFVRVEEGEPLWFDLRGNSECAVLCAIQRLNPVTGKPADLEKGLSKDPAQNYLKLPEQYWLDGYAKDGKVYQFVVTKAGIGLAVSEFVLPAHMQDSHALGFAFFAPKVERRPNVGGHSFTPSNMMHLMHQVQKNNLSLQPIMSVAPTVWVSNQNDGSLSFTVCNASMRLRDNQSSRGVLRTSGSKCFGSEALSYDCEELTSGGINLHDSDDICVSAAEPCVAYSEACSEAYSQDVILGALGEIKAAADSIDSRDFEKASMGMGGRISQAIHPDNNSVDYYTDKPSGLLNVYFALPEMFEAIMKEGKRQDVSRPDKFVHSGEIDGIQVPLISQNK